MKTKLLSIVLGSVIATSSLYASGCKVINEDVKPIILKELNVVFKLASDKFVDPKLANAEISEYANYLKASNLYSTVEGHTSSDASAAYNKGLSSKRAARVKSELIKKGVSAKKLVSFGYGESKPALDNSKDSLNRRIEAAAFHTVSGLKNYVSDSLAFIRANGLKEK